MSTEQPPTGHPSNVRIELPVDHAEALTLTARLAEDWNGHWSPEDASSGGAAGRLGLPVLAGVRSGWVEGRVTIEPAKDDDGSVLHYVQDREEYRVRKSMVALLLFSAWAALVVLIFPIFPRLLPLLPICLMILVGSWLFIVGALRNSGPEEFFEMLEVDAASAEDESPETDFQA